MRMPSLAAVRVARALCPGLVPEPLGPQGSTASGNDGPDVMPADAQVERAQAWQRGTSAAEAGQPLVTDLRGWEQACFSDCLSDVPHVQAHVSSQRVWCVRLSQERTPCNHTAHGSLQRTTEAGA